jgi:hypothetical protein
MSIHLPVTGGEAADRLAIRELVDAYAHCADRRDAGGQMALFTDDTHFAVVMDARNPEPTQDLHGREALAPVFDALNDYTKVNNFGTTRVLRPSRRCCVTAAGSSSYPARSAPCTTWYPCCMTLRWPVLAG